VTDIMHSAVGWRSLLVVVVAFGLLPGLILRVIVILFPRDDLRRKELQAELYAVPWWERPLWVAQQVEVALFEGCGARVALRLDSVARTAIVRTFRSQAIRQHLLETIETVPRGERLPWALTECVSAARAKWDLQSGVERNASYPDTFWIPDVDEKESVRPGDTVKLMFETSDDWGERMWIKVEKRRRRGFVGTVSNVPIGIPRLGFGDRVKFMADHIIDIDAGEPD
jgi:hypothetical protein